MIITPSVKSYGRKVVHVISIDFNAHVELGRIFLLKTEVLFQLKSLFLSAVVAQYKNLKRIYSSTSDVLKSTFSKLIKLLNAHFPVI